VHALGSPDVASVAYELTSFIYQGDPNHDLHYATPAMPHADVDREVASGDTWREIPLLLLWLHKGLLIRGDVAGAWEAFALAEQALALVDKAEYFWEEAIFNAESVKPTYSPRVASLLERLNTDRQATMQEARDYAFEVISAALPPGRDRAPLHLADFRLPEERGTLSRRQRFDELVKSFCQRSFDNFIAALHYFGDTDG
jgi:hypothetical protein